MFGTYLLLSGTESAGQHNLKTPKVGPHFDYVQLDYVQLWLPGSAPVGSGCGSVNAVNHETQLRTR